MKEQFVLVYGAWHGGWCRDGVASHLEKAGFDATAPAMPGHHPSDERSEIKLSDYPEK